MVETWPDPLPDWTLRTELDNLRRLPYQAEPSLVQKLLFDMEYIRSHMTHGAISDQDWFIKLRSKVDQKTYTEMRSDSQTRCYTEDYESFKKALLQKSTQDWADKQLSAVGPRKSVMALEDKR